MNARSKQITHGLRVLQEKRGQVLLPLLAVLSLGIVSLALSVASFFLLGPETSALVRSARTDNANPWQKRVALSVGGMTFGVVRLAGHLPKLPPEARAAMQTVRSAEVGVYQLKSGTSPSALDRSGILSRADASMSRRGWERVVGVQNNRELVAVYAPTRGLTPRSLHFCILVCTDKELVVARASGDPRPIMELAAAASRPFPR